MNVIVNVVLGKQQFATFGFFNLNIHTEIGWICSIVVKKFNECHFVVCFETKVFNIEIHQQNVKFLNLWDDKKSFNFPSVDNYNTTTLLYWCFI